MNWEAIGALGEVVGAGAVVVTLIYLTTQIRQNTRAMRSSSFQTHTDALNAINMQIATDPDLLRLFSSPRASLRDLSPEDQRRFSFVLLSLFRTRETAFFQKNEGTMALQAWSREDVSMRYSLKNATTREWWRDTEFGFTPEFSAYVDSVILEIEENEKRGRGTEDNA